jgi:cytoskeletal protein CcmA (bactofilin family)
MLGAKRKLDERQAPNGSATAHLYPRPAVSAVRLSNSSTSNGNASNGNGSHGNGSNGHESNGHGSNGHHSNVTAPNGSVRKGAVLAHASRPSTAEEHTTESKEFLSTVPVITGEAHFRGALKVEGILSGQLGANNSVLSIKQKCIASCDPTPELNGELTFKDVVRVSGHIAGSVASEKGTFIVDVGARVDARVDVAVAVISGTVNGDIIARERVEVGPVAKIHGNIWTRSITIKDGAIFEGVCRMIEEIYPEAV